MRYRASGIVLFPEVRIACVRTRNTASSGIQTPQGIACLLLEVRVEGRRCDTALPGLFYFRKFGSRVCVLATRHPVAFRRRKESHVFC
ncbi:hypothetical protein NDU88_001573 [Pleurodeles waltl]|uniref:Secreted protein n=1 Tax=Pleurodeles waltl TaxID=8319 RepID=A0AAV7L9V7_PLEWA|nr:hypothetical protein NDU88_001573 [Pleurodeles waltl]